MDNKCFGRIDCIVRQQNMSMKRQRNANGLCEYPVGDDEDGKI